MAEMKLSNEAVIAAANEMVRNIQCERSKDEENFVDAVYKFTSNMREWPWSKKPDNIVELLEWGMRKHSCGLLRMLTGKNCYYWNEYNRYFTSIWSEDYGSWLVSERYEEQHETCLKLKCMAENNEDDYMWISRDEAIKLGVC